MITLLIILGWLILSTITFIILTYLSIKDPDSEIYLDKFDCALLGLFWFLTLTIFVGYIILVKPVNWLDAKIRKWATK